MITLKRSKRIVKEITKLQKEGKSDDFIALNLIEQLNSKCFCKCGGNIVKISDSFEKCDCCGKLFA